MANFNVSAGVTDEGAWGSLTLWGDAGDPGDMITMRGPLWHDNPGEIDFDYFNGGDANVFYRFSLPDIAGTYEAQYASYTSNFTVSPEAASSITGNIGFGWNGGIRYPNWDAVNNIDLQQYMSINGMQVIEENGQMKVMVGVRNDAGTTLTATTEFTADVDVNGSIDGSTQKQTEVPATTSNLEEVFFDVKSTQDREAQFCTEVINVEQ